MDADNGDVYQSPIVQRVLDSNPLLEAFGNAKTVRNDNSSRFGKYIQLQFDAEDPLQAAYLGKSLPSCVLAGSKCEVYLLEKSRVVMHEDDERTYHIFYQLLSSSDEIKSKFWNRLAGTDNDSFRYIGYTDTDTIEGQTDAERFQKTIESLALVGIEDNKLHSLMQSICIVLQLGNLVFQVDSRDESRSVVASQDEFGALAELMGVAADELLAALTIRTVTARNEVFKVPLSAVQAKESCDAFAKEIYAKAFLWLVRSINDATCAEINYDGVKKSGFGTIGLLDIFGFETFEVNRFEQLCINYANEKLQQKFTQDIFRSVQAEYEFEGIELGEITYDDNTDVLDLVEGRMGLIAFLNEECVRPGGSDKAFVSKAAATNKENPCFIRENGFHDMEFGVNHYAGRVVYDATSFVTKNMDTLPSDLQDCATKSSNIIVAKELTNEMSMNEPPTPVKNKTSIAKSPAKRKGSNLVGQTVWTKFKNQLTALMTNLKLTRTRYIRCIKPNTMKRPLIMQHWSTVEQLRCAGVVAAVTISRSAFPNRLEHAVVLERFRAVWQKGAHHHAEKVDKTCDIETKDKHLVDSMLTSALKHLETTKEDKVVKAFVMGNTRTYFRAGALEFLENERVKCLSRWAVEIQRITRRYIARTQYVRLKRIAVYLESLGRMVLIRRQFVTKQQSAIRMQCWFRCIFACRWLIHIRRNHMATLLQAHRRRLVASKLLQSILHATITVQRIARGYIQRPKYRDALIEFKEEAKLENQVRALQRKLEEAERRRIEAEQRAEDKAAVIVNHQEQMQTPVKSSEEKKEDEKSAAESAESFVSGPRAHAIAPSPGQLSAQQQTLMDESGKMLEYLRKEVFKLRKHNADMRKDFDLLKDNNQRLMDANASAGASFAALNQHAKQLSRTNDKLSSELTAYKQQVQKLSVTQVELKEELKMKQATYIAEVHSRLQYQKALSKIIDVAQDKCRDDRLVEQFLRIADTCEAEYMRGPTGMSPRRPLFSTPTRANDNGNANNDGSESGLMSSIRNLWS
jgi:myosin V